MLIRLAVFIFALILLVQSFFGNGSASLDGSFPLENGTITHITDYNRMDQCMAEPGYYHVHHNSFVFFLEQHQFCGGGPKGTEGFLLCYKGQLDKNENMFRGLMPNCQFELLNVHGNAVAKRCADAGHPGWHGMLIYTDDHGQWVIKFSTTNQTFVITGKHLELLILKLASAKDGGESFLSKTFGPKRDFMDWSRRESFGAAEEADNRIRIGQNEQLKKLFMELVKHQALLRNYVGIWSLGLDMLPTDENVYHLDLYTQKSECCKGIQAFFNLPTAQYPEPKKDAVQPVEETIDMEGHFLENITATLDGIVNPDAKNLSFEMVDLFHPTDGKDQGMRLIVDFTNNSIIFERMKNKIWKTNSTRKGFKYHFAAGVAFHLYFILGKNGVIVNMNCYGEVKLPAVGEIDFKNAHRIKIAGDYKYFKGFNIGTVQIKNSWAIKKGISAKNNGGIVLRGKVDENVKKFSVMLWTKGEDEIGFFECIFELEVDITSQGFYISNGSKNFVKDLAKKHSYDAESPFEALILFEEDTFDIWMNNTPIVEQYKNPAGLRVVNYVQIRNDASGDMVQLIKVPITCDYEMSSYNQNSLEIVGKVLPAEKTSFMIELKTVNDKVNLQVKFIFEENNTNIVATEFLTAGRNKQSNFVEPKLKMGEYMQIKINYKTEEYIGISINGDEERLIIATKKFDITSKFAISDDFILEKMNVNTESCM